MADNKKVILVTGVAGYWGSRVAAHLVAKESYHVLGLDAKTPAGKIGALDFVLADVRNPLLVELLKAEGVDTVCHLAFRSSTRRSESAFDANVVEPVAQPGDRTGGRPRLAESRIRQILGASGSRFAAGDGLTEPHRGPPT